MTEAETIQERVREAVARLGEHVEAAQVLVSWRDGESTHSCYIGCGWFARTGMAADFLDSDTARTSANELRKVIQREDE